MPIDLMIHEEEVKETKTQSYFSNIIKLGVYTLLGVVVVVGLKYGQNLYDLEQLKKESNTLGTEEEKVKDVSESYNMYVNHEARTILANHTYFSGLVEYFEKSITSDVTINNFYFLSDYTGIARGISKGGLLPYSKFAAYLSERGFTNIAVKSTVVNPENNDVSFEVNFSFDKKKVIRDESE